MMRAALPAVLLLMATSAWAELVKITETADITFYVDPGSIGRKGNFRQVSVIQDYAGLQHGAVRSRQVLYEIDCSGERLRSLSVTEHSEPMARGQPLSSSQRESEWVYVATRTGTNIPPRTPYRTILRFACSR